MYGSTAEFDKAIRMSTGQQKSDSVPETYVGFGQNKKFHIIARSVYKVIFPKDTDRAYLNLVTHELTHLFHIAYLDGHEEKMGPVWFYEGFACLVADQYPGAPPPSREQISKITINPTRGDYQIYVAILRLLAKRKSIRALLAEASEAEFSRDVGALLTQPK